MFSRKQNFKLSPNLKLGIEGPSSQGTFFKVSGVFFLILSIFLARNIYKSVNAPVTAEQTSAVNPNETKVLGAFDQNNGSGQQSNPTPAPVNAPATYTVLKGDTLFSIAQAQQINWVVIATLNNLHAPYTLKPGTVLKLR